jgi:hypothetical protein
MLLQKHKILFTLNQVIELIKVAESYTVSTYSYIPDQWSFSCYYNGRFYSLILGIQKDQVKYISVSIDSQSIRIDYKSEYSEIFKNIKNEYCLKVLEIENAKFSKIFPNYSKEDDRDGKIETLLDLTSCFSEDKSKRKKLFGIF